MTKRSFIVTLDLPRGVGVRQMVQYIRTEIKANIGRLDPEEPLADLDRDSVKVKFVPKTVEWQLHRLGKS